MRRRRRRSCRRYSPRGPSPNGSPGSPAWKASGLSRKIRGKWARTRVLGANGLIAEGSAVGGKPRGLAPNPVQFDEKPVQLTRAPQFAEHTDDILRALGKSDDELIDLKISGAVT